MSLRVFRHQLGEVTVTAGTDEVVGSMPIPSECSQNNVWGSLHVLGEDDNFTTDALLYGVDGFVVPVPDPDTPDSVDDIWDRLIDKDDDLTAGALDLDETAADTDNLYEAGEPSIGTILDAHLYQDDNHWFKKRGMVTFATSPTGFNFATSNLSTYQPRDVVRVRSRKRIYTEFMSMSLLGVSMPTVITTATVPNTPGHVEWMQEKYIEVILEQAWMTLLGLTEAGAESPWENAASLIQAITEPDVFEDTTGRFQSATQITVFGELTWDVSVPGRREFKVLTGEV